jgi:hypothetical protein
MLRSTSLKTVLCHMLPLCGLRQQLDSTLTFSQSIFRQNKSDKMEGESAFTHNFRFRSFMINVHET